MRDKGSGGLFKRADGLWVATVELPPGPNGKRRRKTVSSKSRNEAIRKLRDLQAQIDAGALPTAPTTTVTKWLDHWLTEILPHRTRAGKHLAPGTMTSYSKTTRLYIKPHIGHKRLDKLTPTDIRAMFDELQRTGGRTGEGSTRNAQKADQALRAALKAAVREGVIRYSVMDRVDKPGHTPAEQSAFNSRMVPHLLNTAQDIQGRMWATRWALGFTTGCRESEVLGLEWDRVDLDAGVIDVAWQLQRLSPQHGCGEPKGDVYPCGKKRPSFCPQSRWVFPPSMKYRMCEGTLIFTKPKTKAGTRLVPLIPPMIETLRELQATDTDNPHGLVLHHPDGKPISQDQDQKAWRSLLEAAGVPHVPQHSVRHSTATLLLEYGAPEHVVQSVIGHTDITVTRGYQHVSMDLAQSFWGKLSAIMPAGE